MHAHVMLGGQLFCYAFNRMITCNILCRSPESWCTQEECLEDQTCNDCTVTLMVIMSSASPPGSACRHSVLARAAAGPERAEDPLVVDGLQPGPRPDHPDEALRVDPVHWDQRDPRGMENLIFLRSYCHQIADEWEENYSKILWKNHGTAVAGSNGIMEVTQVGEHLYFLPQPWGTRSRA